MKSLYGQGWRQGSIFDAALPLSAVILGAAGAPELKQETHSVWVIASQDCDLDFTDSESGEPCIELRPVYSQDPPTDWGIRSRRLLLADGVYVISNSPRQHVAPVVLTQEIARGTQRQLPEDARRQAFKTWLGLRYDRPAVPPNLLALARSISEEVTVQRRRTTMKRVRDVLMQFDESATPVRYSLFAILDESTDEEAMRAVLADVGMNIPSDLGVLGRVEAATTDGIAFSTIESSYAADVSRVTWRPNQPDPDGAT